MADRYEGIFHLIFHSTELPPDVFQTLGEIQREHQSWLRLVAVSPAARLADLVRHEVFSLSRGKVCFNYRIDDDDALSVDFLDAIVGTGHEWSEGTVVSFDLGAYVQRISSERFTVSNVDYPKIAIGLGVFSGPRFHRCVFDLPVHHRIPDAQVSSIRDKCYWLRTIHSRNDSGTRARAADSVSIDEACALLSSRYGNLPLRHALSNLSVAPETTRVKSADRILFDVQ